MNEFATKINGKIIYSNYGYISYKYRDDIYFKIAKITYEIFESEEYQFIFEPYYDVLNAFPSLDIPGLDLSLKLKEYYRANIMPVFVSERIIPRNRVNLQEELKKLNMDYYNPFLLLLDSKMVYGGDRLSVKSDTYYSSQMGTEKEPTDLYKLIPFILKKLATRNDMTIGKTIVNDDNRKTLISTYLFLYQKVSKYYDKKSQGNKGRKKQEPSFIALEGSRKLYKLGIISIDEAVRQSGLGSRSTYYRRLKEAEEKENLKATEND